MHALRCVAQDAEATLSHRFASAAAGRWRLHAQVGARLPTWQRVHASHPPPSPAAGTLLETSPSLHCRGRWRSPRLDGCAACRSPSCRAWSCKPWPIMLRALGRPGARLPTSRVPCLSSGSAMLEAWPWHAWSTQVQALLSYLAMQALPAHEAARLARIQVGSPGSAGGRHETDWIHSFTHSCTISIHGMPCMMPCMCIKFPVHLGCAALLRCRRWRARCPAQSCHANACQGGIELSQHRGVLYL